MHITRTAVKQVKYTHKNIFTTELLIAEELTKNLLNIFQCPYNDNNPHLQVSKLDILYLNT